MAEKPKKGKVEFVPKPSPFNLDKFKSKRPASVAGVETLQTGLPHHSIAHAKDFVRLHHDEDAYWSPELCFVNVPIKGQKRDTLHLIDEDLAMRYLPSGKITSFPLGSRDEAISMSSSYVMYQPGMRTTLGTPAICLLARRARLPGSRSAAERRRASKRIRSMLLEMPMPSLKPSWPTESLTDLIDKTFTGRMIDHEDHPALLRLIGAKQSVS